MPSIDKETQDRIRANVRAYLTANNLSAKEVAERMGIQTQTLHNYMSKTVLTEKTVRKMSEALGYPHVLLRNGNPYLGDNQLASLERRIRRIEEMLNITPE